MTKDEAALIASATLDEAWPMVEHFSTIRRESAAEGNRAISAVVERLRQHGVPVTVHEPNLYLTVPKFGYVEAEGKPPAPAPRADDLAGAAGRRGAARSMSRSRSVRRKAMARRAPWCSAKATIRRPASAT